MLAPLLMRGSPDWLEDVCQHAHLRLPGLGRLAEPPPARLPDQGAVAGAFLGRSRSFSARPRSSSSMWLYVCQSAAEMHVTPQQKPHQSPNHEHVSLHVTALRRPPHSMSECG